MPKYLRTTVIWNEQFSSYKYTWLKIYLRFTHWEMEINHHICTYIFMLHLLFMWKVFFKEHMCMNFIYNIYGICTYFIIEILGFTLFSNSLIFTIYMYVKYLFILRISYAYHFFYHISASFPSTHSQNCSTLTNGICGLSLCISVGNNRSEVEDFTLLFII